MAKLIFMKRKWIFLFTTFLLLFSYHSKASNAYYEESDDEDREVTNEEYLEAAQISASQAEYNNEFLAERLREEHHKLLQLSNSIDIKLPLEKELEADLEDSESDSTEVKQSAISRKPAIKKEDQIDSTEEETESLFPEESDEVSLTNSAIQKPIAKEELHRKRKIRSR